MRQIADVASSPLHSQRLWALQCDGLLDRNNLVELRFNPPFLSLKVKRHLCAKPITIRQAKVTTETEIGIGRHTTPPQNNLPDTLSRNPGLLSKAILRNTHGNKKLLFEKLTRSHR